MAHYAKIVDGIVDKVITADASFFDTFIDDSPGTWIETTIDGSTRKNYAGVGYTYDSTRDAFIAPKPYPSWTLIEDTCQWAASVAMPDDDKMYTWNEDTTAWVEVT
tara:strand:- start:49 stop:366 length:318 start_codon:yes stop_codon:yes gene_type:complete